MGLTPRFGAPQIKNRLKDEAVTLALPSQRVDRFDDNIANIVGGTRTTGLTFAPEGGTQRMRDIINKVRRFFLQEMMAIGQISPKSMTSGL